MTSLFDLAALLITLTALFGWINHKFIGLPNTIGLLVMGLAASVLLVAVELVVPHATLHGQVAELLHQVDFYEAVMNGMLAFLLFAGALHVDFPRLRSRSAMVLVMATFGVVVSTVIIAVGFWFASRVAGIALPFAWALVFGALISPTDPVAVLSTLKAARVPEVLETDMAGESLFNDGVGVVLFTILLALATAGENSLATTRLFTMEAIGGALFGAVTGYVAYRAMRWIDDYVVEVMISLALVMGTYAAARHLHLSGPIAVVIAGLLIGERGPADAMSDTTQRYLFGFWTLIDEILNSVLFLLIGLELLVIGLSPAYAGLAILAVPLSLLARAIAVGIPVLVLGIWQRFARGTVAVLTWGGVRGGISIALALSLPHTPQRPMIVTATYVVVLFTIVVQGLTLGMLARRVCEERRNQSGRS